MRRFLFPAACAAASIFISVVVTNWAVHAQPAQRASSEATSASAPVTWSAQIAPILYSNCTTCHHPGGGGPFSLLTWQDAQRWAPQITHVTQSRFMPPWLPEHGYGDFEGERRLTDAEIALIAKWVKAGAPEGDAKLAPQPPHYSATWQRGTPDLILAVERPYALQASGTDVFRNFVLPYPLNQTHYIRAMEIRPSVPAIVHHANVLIDRTASFRREHSQDWKDGVPGMELMVDAGNTFDPDSSFLFWKPDSPVLVEAKGMPWRLDPGNDLILNMHLKPSGKSETVFAQIGLYFTDEPPTQHPMLLQLDADSDLDIPPADANFVVQNELKLPVDVDVLGIYPHAHYLGKDLEGWATLPDGQKKWLIRIPGWDIDRQSVYRYRAPVFLPKGSTVHMRYLYDNSANNVHNPHSPPVRVRAGNQSTDEMAHLWLQVLPVHTPQGAPDPRLVLEAAWMRNRLRKEPDDSIALYNLAAALAGEGKYSEAADAYKQELTANPSDARALNGLGAALENAGDTQQAKSVWTQVLTAGTSGDQTEVCNARFNLGELALKRADDGEAETQFRAMITGCPADAAAHSGLGAALAADGEGDAAVAEFQNALAIDPQNFTALYNLGDLELQSGQFARAIETLESAVKTRGDDFDTREHLAAAYAQAGRIGDAVAQLREAIRISPNDAGVHALLSQALSATGDLQSAIAEQKDALRLQANDADGWNNLGVLEAQAGSNAAAREDFRHALQIAPDHAQAKANLERLPPG
jgi:Flp pilus assembly protein TadD